MAKGVPDARDQAGEVDHVTQLVLRNVLRLRFDEGLDGARPLQGPGKEPTAEPRGIPERPPGFLLPVGGSDGLHGREKSGSPP